MKKDLFQENGSCVCFIKLDEESPILSMTSVNVSKQPTLSTLPAGLGRSALLHRLNPARNEARSYYVLIGPALLDRHAVVRVWGRIGGQQRVMVTPCQTDDDEARTLARKLIQLRLRHGYTLVWNEMSGEM
jgi:predicted DNA-binding WGR domain protein